MSMMSRPPFVIITSLFRALFKLLTGRVHFSNEYMDKVFVADDGQKFRVFRDMVYRPGSSARSDVPAIFAVSFKFAKFGFEKNHKLSRIPIPLILGHPGFMEKIWTVNEETGYWRGIYQWESEDAAEIYSRSFVLGKMAKRAIPESISMEILPQTNLADYMKQHLQEEE